MSIDAETNGLFGKAFAISVVVRDENGLLLTFLGRCPIVGPVNSWVEENVLPEMEDVEINYPSYEEMLKGFAEFYLKHRSDADIIVHMGVPVESKLFIDCQEYEFLDMYSFPYPLIDISAFPEINVSVDTYNKVNNLSVTDICKRNISTHHPLYDAYAALVAYLDLMSKNHSK